MDLFLLSYWLFAVMGACENLVPLKREAKGCLISKSKLCLGKLPALSKPWRIQCFVRGLPFLLELCEGNQCVKLS